MSFDLHEKPAVAAVHKLIVVGILLSEGDFCIPEALLAVYRHYTLRLQLFEFVEPTADHLVVPTGCSR